MKNIKLFMQWMSLEKLCICKFCFSPYSIYLINTSRFLFTFLLILIFTSCKKGDWFDIKSNKSVTTPATLGDMQALLNNVVIMNEKSVALGEIGTDDYSLTTVRANNLSASNYNAYTWSHNNPYVAVSDWSSANNQGSYPRIYYCNTILDELPKIIPTNKSEQEEWNDIKGQALFQRARTFFELAQVFAPPFNLNTASTDLSIPLRLEADINIPTKRSTVKQTYDQIINDLKISKDLLPVGQLYKTQPSKPAAFALLARVYLSMEDYKKAGEYADSCLRLYNGLLDYNTLSTLSTMPISIFNPEVILHTRTVSYSSLVSSNMIVDSMLYTLYSNNDLRRNILFFENSNGVIQFKGTYSGASSLQFTGLATDEMYLIKSECYAREGKISDSMATLNILLRKRWKEGTFEDFTATTGDSALRLVLTERRKELLFRGLRWSDLRRLNRDERFKVTPTRVVGDKVFTLTPNSYQYTLPLPDDVVQITGIMQNPGWER